LLGDDWQGLFFLIYFLNSGKPVNICCTEFRLVFALGFEVWVAVLVYYFGFSGIVPEQWVVCGFVGFCGSGYGGFVGYFYLFGLVFGELEGVAPAVPSVWGVVGVPEGAVYGQDDIVKGIVFCPYAVAAGGGVLEVNYILYTLLTNAFGNGQV